MKSHFIVVLLGCALSVLAQSATAAANVTLIDRGAYVTLDNGIVSFDLDKKNGDVLALRYAGQSLLARPAYFDWVTEGNNHFTRGEFALRVDPTGNGGEMAEISISQKYNGTGDAFDVALHYVLRRGDSGYYSYAIFSHPKEYPAAGMAQSRMVLRPTDKLFDFINIDDQRRFPMPPADTPYREVGPKESMLITEGPFKGYMADKYHLFADAGDHFVHGWSGTKSGLGCWIVYGSTEDHNGGPTKQHNTAHFKNVLHKILTCRHYGAGGIAVENGREWQKLYGPWMVYLNKGESTDALWADAKAKAESEKAVWPHAWMKHPAYPLAEQRGRVSGQLTITDPQNSAASPAGAWIGLAAPSPDWQQQAMNYQFWVRAGSDGRFEIPSVRPGEYTLYAFVDGVMDEFRADGVKVEAGRTVDLGKLDWRPVRHGRQLWQIGTPDRTAREFRHGDDHRQWGLSRKYPEEFPNDVNFVIGKSNERTDWNYAQVTVQRDGQFFGTKWNVLFNVTEPIKPGKATLRVAVAGSQAADLRVLVNGRPVAALTDLYNDNSMARAGIHGQYSLRDVTFDASMLRPGENRITFDQQAGKSWQKNVMYDAIRLEVPN